LLRGFNEILNPKHGLSGKVMPTTLGRAISDLSSPNKKRRSIGFKAGLGYRSSNKGEREVQSLPTALFKPLQQLRMVPTTIC